MHCNVWCDKDLCGTNVCNQRLTRIIRINKTCTEKCRFTVDKEFMVGINKELISLPELIPILVGNHRRACSGTPMQNRSNLHVVA